MAREGEGFVGGFEDLLNRVAGFGAGGGDHRGDAEIAGSDGGE